MAIIGRIEGTTESNRIDIDSWINLITLHPCLSMVPPRMGINPFTRETMEFKAPATTAIVSIERTCVGTIFCTMDGSPVLVVEAEDNSENTVAGIAEEIAHRLGGRFALTNNNA